MAYAFPVPRSLMLNRSYCPCLRIPQSATAWRVTGIDLMFKRSRHGKGKKSIPEVTISAYPPSGRDLLNILSGLRAGNLSIFL
jgi:hypothetical protein